MKTKILILLSFILTIGVSAQIKRHPYVDLPPNAQPGKCYESLTNKNFDYNKIYKNGRWLEVSCDKVKKDLIARKTDSLYCKRDSIKNYRSCKKLEKYKERLHALGYKVELNKTIDVAFLKVHNKYLKKKRRAERRRKRREAKKKD